MRRRRPALPWRPGWRPGTWCSCQGELGAGKTTFVRGACRALGVTEPVTSPTFTIGTLLRGATWRSPTSTSTGSTLAGEDPALLDDYLTPDRIAFVEWPGVAEDDPMRVAARVRLEHPGATGGGSRWNDDAARPRHVHGRVDAPRCCARRAGLRGAPGA